LQGLENTQGFVADRGPRKSLRPPRQLIALDSIDHYENFPVASLLLPRRLRQPIALIYRFARGADDIADEGDDPPAARLQKLAVYSAELDRIEAGQLPEAPLFRALKAVIEQWRLPLRPFRDLLDAFSQDVIKSRYANFAELLDYSRRSANPVGRLLLYLFDAATSQHLRWSDAICTSLQLINFWQDVALDWQKGRIYLPVDEMARYGVDEQNIASANTDESWQRLLRFQIERSRNMLESGAPLGAALPGRVGLEIRTIVAGGAAILHKLEAANGDMFRHRPTLNSFDWARIVFRATFRRPP
jgi:squalene synthase HpnC